MMEKANRLIVSRQRQGHPSFMMVDSEIHGDKDGKSAASFDGA